MGNLGTKMRMISKHAFKKQDMMATWGNVFRHIRKKLFDLLHFLEHATQFFMENIIYNSPAFTREIIVVMTTCLRRN